MRSGRNRGSIARTSGDSGIDTVTTSPSSEANASSSGARRRTPARTASAISSCVPRSTRSRARTGSRRTRYGAVAPYGSARTVMVRTSNPASASATTRLLPVPLPPLTTTTPPSPMSIRPTFDRMASSSTSRPSSGNEVPAPVPRVPVSSATASTGTGTVLPFMGNGPAGVVAKRVRERSRTVGWANSTPCGALPMMRAAVLVVSPIAEYAARSTAPTSAANTCPRLTPICSGSGVPTSRTRRIARSMRPSSSSLE